MVATAAIRTALGRVTLRHRQTTLGWPGGGLWGARAFAGASRTPRGAGTHIVHNINDFRTLKKNLPNYYPNIVQF